MCFVRKSLGTDGLNRPTLETQGVLRILLPCTRSILGCITNTGCGIGDSAARALGCVADCVRHSFGGVSDGTAESSNCTVISS